MEYKNTLNKKNGVRNSLLDEDALIHAILQTRTLEEEKARFHADVLIHRVFAYEKSQVHRRLLQDFRDGVLPIDNPMQATKVENEFNINMLTQNVPRALYGTLEDWSTLTSKVVHIAESADYVTTKLLIELQGGHRVESVILRHSKRTTLCVSSQVGRLLCF
jgi:hypothetical protein